MIPTWVIYLVWFFAMAVTALVLDRVEHVIGRRRERRRR